MLGSQQACQRLPGRGQVSIILAPRHGPDRRGSRAESKAGSGCQLCEQATVMARMMGKLRCEHDDDYESEVG